jgi:type II secretion system protein C
MKRGAELYIRKVLFISKLSLVLALGYVVAIDVVMPLQRREIFAPKSAAGTASIDEVELAARSSVRSGDYSVIIEHNIFSGSALIFDPKTFLPGSGANDSGWPAEEELGLALLGTVAGSPALSRAIIEDIETRVLDSYKPGDSVAEARIESIDEDVVVLRHEGQRKTLSLGSRPAAELDVDNDTEPTVQQDNVQTSQPPEVDTQPPSPVTVRTKLRSIETVLKKAIIKPFIVAGEVQGLRVDGLERIKGVKNLGLKNGDIIRMVNGQHLTSKQKAYQVFKKARRKKTISVELVRDNQIRTLLFSLK